MPITLFDITFDLWHDRGMPSDRSTFSLRFDDDLTHRALRTVARARNVSINALIGEMIARELPREIEQVESELAGSLDALRSYKRAFADDWAAFAKAEGEVGDPLQAARVDPSTDPLGIEAVFA